VSFEEVAYLLLHGRLPDSGELTAFRDRLGKARALPAEVVQIIALYTTARPMTVLRTAVSALAAVAEAGTDPAEHVDPRERLVARIPTILASHHRLRSGWAPPEPDPSAGQAEDLLAMLSLAHDADRVRALDTCLVVQAEHGANASTLAARVVASTEADGYAAAVAAIAAFDGPLHGGAAERVMDMVAEVGSADSAADYVRARRVAGQPVMGFGHRVYKTEDPRARHLRDTARRLAARTGDTGVLDVLEALRDAMAPFRGGGLDINVDFYSGTVYQQLGLPADLSVPVFAAARMPGWLAHVDEQRQAKVLIRPTLRYVGTPVVSR
jgi:citrate synthase